METAVNLRRRIKHQNNRKFRGKECGYDDRHSQLIDSNALAQVLSPEIQRQFSMD